MEDQMLRLSVSGMTCGHCAGTVKEAVQNVAPGANVQVDLATGTVAVDKRDSALIRSAIKAARYTVVNQAA
jgi:copper chaperone